MFKRIAIVVLASATVFLSACSAATGYVFIPKHWTGVNGDVSKETVIYSVTRYKHDSEDVNTEIAAGELSYEISSGGEHYTLTQNMTVTHNNVVAHNNLAVDTMSSVVTLVKNDNYSYLYPISVNKTMNIRSSEFDPATDSDRATRVTSYSYSANYADGLHGQYTFFNIDGGIVGTENTEFGFTAKQLRKAVEPAYDNEQLFLMIRAMEPETFKTGATFNLGVVSVTDTIFGDSDNLVALKASIKVGSEAVKVPRPETIPESFFFVFDNSISCLSTEISFGTGPAINAYFSNNTGDATRVLIKVVQKEYDLSKMAVKYSTEYVIKTYATE